LDVPDIHLLEQKRELDKAENPELVVSDEEELVEEPHAEDVLEESNDESEEKKDEENVTKWARRQEKPVILWYRLSLVRFSQPTSMTAMHVKREETELVSYCT
jgi:hypothetical protein